jgi:hypothetical protein
MNTSFDHLQHLVHLSRQSVNLTVTQLTTFQIPIYYFKHNPNPQSSEHL